MRCLAWCANPLLEVQFHRKQYMKQVQSPIVNTLPLLGKNRCIGSNQDHDYIQFMARDNPGDGVPG